MPDVVDHDADQALRSLYMQRPVVHTLQREFGAVVDVDPRAL